MQNYNQNNDQYDATNIQILEGLDGVKKRPEMYIGDTSGSNGTYSMAMEAIDNAVDEMPYCNKIKISFNRDNSMTIADNGRGIPVDMHQNSKQPAVILIMTKLHAGGKFNDDAYKYSGGLHGVGISVVNALSEFVNLEIKRDQKKYYCSFANGVLNEDLKIIGDCAENETGTAITFKPSKEIFSNCIFDKKRIINKLEEVSFLNPEIQFEVIDDTQPNDSSQPLVINNPNGVQGFVLKIAESHGMIHSPIAFNIDLENASIGCCLVWTESFYGETIPFTNNIKQKDGGTHLIGFRAALTKSINNYLVKEKIVKKSTDTVTGEDVREGLYAVLSIKIKDPKFSSQTKDKLVNEEVRSIVESNLISKFSEWLEENPSDSRKICNRILCAFSSREAMKKARDLNRRKTPLDNVIGCLPGKLADCQEKDPSLCEIYIVEGESAGGSAKLARARERQAVLAAKGKILNVEKSRENKILDSNEIKSIIAALGVNIGREDNASIEKLRYHKVIIMTDADVDGLHIRTLLLTFFFRYMRPIVEKGHLYIAQPPLYKVTHKRNNKYIQTESELSSYIIHNALDISSISVNEVEICKEQIPGIIAFSRFLQSYIYENFDGEYKIFEEIFQKIFTSNDNEEVINEYIKQYDCKIQIDLERIILIRTTKHEMKEYIILRNSDKFNHIKSNFKKYTSYIAKILIIKLKKGETIEIDSISLLHEKFMAIGKEGMYIQRFKGLGEMNADQLWDTTMNPQTRILLKISIPEHGGSSSDHVFSMLMGNSVELRRKFIEENALFVNNLDV